MKTRQSGFTLIELLIVIVILAILATIAWPSYQTFIRQTRLNNVRSELAQNAKLLERYYAQKGTFESFDKPDKELFQNEYFNITLTEKTASGYILKAEPTEDSLKDCTVYLNDSGIFWASSSSCPGYEEPHK